MTNPHQLFEFQNRLGQGGSAWVYRVLDRKTGRIRALKQMRPDRAPDPVDRALFAQEVTILKRLDISGVPRIHQVDLEETYPWFTLDLIEGTTLQETLENSNLNTLEQVDLLAQTSIIVGQIHHKGVVHHDLKPTNILIGSHWNPWVVDFGVGSFVDCLPPAGTQDYLVGTLSYLSPERIQNPSGPHAPTADVYALGVILYSMLSGRMPFSGATDAELFDRIRRSQPPRPETFQNESIPTTICDLTMRALSRCPKHRPPNARVFATDLLHSLIDHAANQSNAA